MTLGRRGHDERMAHELAVLRRDLAGQVPSDVLDRVLAETLREFDAARIKEFVPVLVHQSVRRRVRELVPAPRQ